MRKVYKVASTAGLTVFALIVSTFMPWVLIALTPFMSVFGFGPLAIYALLTKSVLVPGIDSRKTVVVVDDDLIALTMAQKAIESIGFRARGFSSPDEALLAIEDMNFDFAVIDQVMPTLSGEDFIKKLDHVLEEKGLTVKPDVLFLTGYPEGVHIDGNQLTHINYKGVYPKVGEHLGSLRSLFSKSLGHAT